MDPSEETVASAEAPKNTMFKPLLVFSGLTPNLNSHLQHESASQSVRESERERERERERARARARERERERERESTQRAKTFEDASRSSRATCSSTSR